MRNLPIRGRPLILVTLVLALVFPAGCTEPAESPTPSTTGEPPVHRAQAQRPPRPTTVLAARPGAEAAIATSAALLRSAPVAVLAAERDRDGVATAGTIAERLGAPVLLTATGVDPGPELARLDPRAVLAIGSRAQRVARAQQERKQEGAVPVFGIEPAGDPGSVPELPAELPVTAAPEPAGVTVLVDQGRDDPAAVATARAVGATIVPVHGTDPRADPAAIEALHADPPGAVLALGKEFGPAERLRARLEVAAKGTRLPGGGQVMLPGRRLVCLYGHPGAPSLGVLGEQGVGASIERARRMAAKYEPLSRVPVVPAFEIIATVAHGEPGPDGDYSGESSVASLRPWVERAGAAGLYVLLDLQPGRADLAAQARRYEPLLRLPHVGLAIDPEWKLGPDQLPLQQVGGVDAAEINRTSAWLAELTAEHDLPQKLFVVHQFRLSMIRNESALVTDRDELSLLIHMDGQGSTGQKDATWRAVVGARPGEVPLGWKNFYDEDHPMLTPEQTMSRRPTPMMISYQ
ncbi:hypothetical protein [Amycolatopsis aidingensis]|uniref:hypothetical protein n=1 Tax=Amycolatopsis aidingensis TaxID=2842453 RepID=UPI001C0A9C46|nr:hypothetical protein [Amycolatopsis aidingensis]